MGAQLSARIKASGVDDVIKVFQWFGTSEHKRAQFLRTGEHGLKTLLRASNFEEYLAFAESPTTGPPRPGQWFEPEPGPEPANPNEDDRYE